VNRREPPKNLAASIAARLRKLARERNEDLQLVLTRYGLERLLYRLSLSPYRDDFVLKGAMLFHAWAEAPHRPTRDLDLLCRGDNSVEHLVTVFRTICEQPVDAEDALVFNAASVRGEEIRESKEYQGLRLTFEARLANIRIPIQIDIGFGDVVTPGPMEIEFPTLLELPAPVLQAYSRETVIAEKFQAMVMLGTINTRMKDFFDLWVLSREHEFDGTTLAAAIGATFERRRTELPAQVPTALSQDFAADAAKQTQWRAFLQRGKLSMGGESFPEVIAALRRFLMPPVEALRARGVFLAYWPAGGPWSEFPQP
jgi:predicted nucleotidyltransferase component of viral defense system